MRRSDKIYLVYVANVPYLMVNPHRELTVGMCNSRVTKNWNVKKEDTEKNVFDFFGVELKIVNIPFDRRTAQFKHFEKTTKYFTVEYLPTLANL